MSKIYYSEGNYYLSTMHSAASIALIKMELSNDVEMTNQSVTIAKEELQLSKDYFENVTATQKVNAPITELYLEMAGVYFEEAEQNDSASIYPLAVDSIRNSMIAKEQTKAISELLTGISEQADPLTTSIATKNVSIGMMDSMGELLKTVSNKFLNIF